MELMKPIYITGMTRVFFFLSGVVILCMLTSQFAISLLGVL
jgi:hypothetical protein